MLDKIVVVGFGLLMMIGGLVGFKHGSKISLYAGLGSGAVILLTYFSALGEKNKFLVLTILAGILAVMFLMRFLKTHKVMPSGMLLGLSLVFLIFCFLRFGKL